MNEEIDKSVPPEETVLPVAIFEDRLMDFAGTRGFLESPEMGELRESLLQKGDQEVFEELGTYQDLIKPMRESLDSGQAPMFDVAFQAAQARIYFRLGMIDDCRITLEDAFQYAEAMGLIEEAQELEALLKECDIDDPNY